MAADRDKYGRFTAGNSAAVGHGNPLLRHGARLRLVIAEALTPAAMRVIVDKLIRLAKDGDLEAIRILYDRAMGKPAPTPSLVSIELPATEDLGGTRAAISRLLEAAAGGEFTLEAAEKIVRIISEKRDCLVADVLAKDVRALEKQMAGDDDDGW